MMNEVYKSNEISIYKIDLDKNNDIVRKYIISTSETREACNDPEICGYEYVKILENTCTQILKSLPYFSAISLYEDETVILNILKDSLIFGMQKSTNEAFEWNIQKTLFYNPQQSDTVSVGKEMSHNMLPSNTQLLIADVIHSGKALRKALESLLEEALAEKKNIDSTILICFGSNRTIEIIDEFAEKCNNHFANFKGVEIFFIEGIFALADDGNKLSVMKEGHDLLKKNANMSPEYAHSQYELPLYPLERCITYNAADRAFNVALFIKDVTGYWEKIKELAGNGLTFNELIRERAPQIDDSKFGKQNLMSLSEQHINKLNRIIAPKPKGDEEGY